MSWLTLPEAARYLRMDYHDFCQKCDYNGGPIKTKVKRDGGKHRITRAEWIDAAVETWQPGGKKLPPAKPSIGTLSTETGLEYKRRTGIRA